MASLRDFFPVVREIGAWTLVKRVWREVQDDHVFVYASALSYAWIFAFFPLLMFLLSLVPFMPGASREEGRHLIVRSIHQILPREAAEQVLSNPKISQTFDTVFGERRGAVLSLSFVIALYAASKGVAAIMTALDRAYEVERGRPFYRSLPLSLMLTAVLTAMVLVVMALIPVGSFVKNLIIDNDVTVPYTTIRLQFWMILAFDLVRHAIGLSVGFLILSIIYNFCPSVKMRWSMFSPGAVFCFVAWVIIGLGFRYYLRLTGGTSFSQTFGPAAGLAILLLVFFLYGVVLLIGAEINSEIDYVRLKVEPGTRDLRPAQKALIAKERAERRAKTKSDAPTPSVNAG